MSHENFGGDPYREAADPNALALENMRKKIEGEGKIPLLVPEEIKVGDNFTEFINKINKGTEFENIVLYSVATGILKHATTNPTKWDKKAYFINYTNQDDSAEVTIYLDKKNTVPAEFWSLITVATTEAHRKKMAEEATKRNEGI